MEAATSSAIWRYNGGGVAGPVEIVTTALQTLHLAQEMVEFSSAPDDPEQHQKSKKCAVARSEAE